MSETSSSDSDNEDVWECTAADPRDEIERLKDLIQFYLAEEGDESLRKRCLNAYQTVTRYIENGWGCSGKLSKGDSPFYDELCDTLDELYKYIK